MSPFQEGGNLGRSDVTPIKHFPIDDKILVSTEKKFDGSDITPSFFRFLMKFGPTTHLIALSHWTFIFGQARPIRIFWTLSYKHLSLVEVILPRLLQT